jgi:aquaporin rerated protein, invertebrate
MSSFSLGTCELSSNAKNNLWRSFLAELIGTFILNFFSCAACTQAKGDVVLISLAFGFSVFVSIAVSYLKRALSLEILIYLI